MGGIITPLQTARFTEESANLIFLAGPIKGARHWQRMAAHQIYHTNSEVLVASPRQIGYETERSADISETDQIDWEQTNLKIAGEHGVILFWLPKEFIHMPERAYAQTSRFEMGKYFTLSIYEGYKVVVGIEEEFSGNSYLRYLLKKDYPKIPVFNTLDDTCWYAVHMLYK